MGDYLLVCESCGNHFFTRGERSFYIEKGLLFPKKCKDCREKRDSNKLIEIKEKQKIEAKQEDVKYFFNVEELNEIVSGNKYFIVGRKGSGKTAIAQKLFDIDDPKIFTEKLSFKNFPFNYLYGLENIKYTAPNQYITIWKYLVYSCVCKMMLRNENIENNVRDALSKIYDSDPIKSLERLVDKWTKKDFGISVLGTGFNLGGERTPHMDISWIDKVNILEDLLTNHLDDSKYFILFDELDEDYRDFKDENEKNTYLSLLTSLFKAVQDIRANFNSGSIKIFPVVFLRNDIYGLIKDSDKNKWSDFRIDMEWTPLKIKKMLSYRLNIVLGTTGLDFNSVWSQFFSDKYLKMGHSDKRTMDIFSYITRSTQLRPRDYIHYLKECAELALSRRQSTISSSVVKEVDDAFSDYLKDEIIDEIHAILPEVNEVFSMLSQIRKQTFPPREFENAYKDMVRKGAVIDKGVENILILLFDFSVIGNEPLRCVGFA